MPPLLDFVPFCFLLVCYETRLGHIEARFVQ
jgi:hypothetical protein